MAHPTRYASHRGFTLVEVVVTLFIIGIGALGVAGLQLAAMRSNQSAFLRSQVTLAAYALVDRMRAEPAEFVDAKLNASDILGRDPANAAETGFRAWVEELAALRLEAAGDQPLAELDCTDANACNTGNCTIIIRWDDSRGDGGAPASDAGGADALAFQLCARVPQ